MAKKQLIPVSERALLARVNRQLIKTGEQIMRCSPKNVSAENELGRFYRVNVRVGGVQKHVDLEDLARELEVLKPYEKLAD